MNLLIIRMRSFFNQEEGQDLIEYALLAALIALAAVVAMTATGQSINGLFGRVQAALGTGA